MKRFIVGFCGLITLGGLGLLYLTGVGHKQPLEAVFDKDSKVVVVFTSYE